MQIQQRQYLADLRGLTRPGGQDRRGKPLALTGFAIHPAVIDPRGLHRHRAGGGQHLPRLVITVADHQPVPVLVELVGEPLDIGGDHGAQRRLQHLPGTGADNLIEQRP